MHEAAARTLRTAERYLLQPPLPAHFDGAAVSVCDISAKGARFTHGHSLQMGQKSLLRLPLEGRPPPLAAPLGRAGGVVVHLPGEGGALPARAFAAEGAKVAPAPAARGPAGAAA